MQEFPGADDIPTGLIKSDVINYIVENRDFPDVWTEGIHSAVCKGESKRSVDDCLRVTTLPLMENVFEIIVYTRLSFVDEASMTNGSVDI